MDIQLNTRNMDITPRLKDYVDKKLNKLDRYLDIDEVRVDLAVENTRSNADRQVAQLTMWTGGTMLRAEERAADIFVAIDAALNKMRRQISRYKKRRQDRRHHTEEELLAEVDVLEEEETEEGSGEIVRIKRFDVLPMAPPEAIEQMELLGHQFFIFLNAEDGNVSVIYRRRDGNYGLITPEVS
ncbi:MAG: ribosome-associated translation inhibitor RaiA [Anaerolineae bacterium]|nr:ribosome-associated translation inhibitor RaiA [Anaerolineae bacterium]